MSHPNLIYWINEDVAVVDVETGEILAVLPTDYIQDVQPTYDDKYVFVLNNENNITIWDLNTLQKIFIWESEIPLGGAWVSPNDDYFLAWGGKEIMVWQFPSE